MDKKWHKVELVNYQTLGARCGYGEGPTLEQAQADALRRARRFDAAAELGDDGRVWFAGGINC